MSLPTNRAKQLITQLAKEADVQINGNRDWDVTVHDERFYEALLKQGSLALGETYMAGWWDCKKIDELIA